MDLFWAQGGKAGRHSLHNSITQLRKLLVRRDLIVRKLDGYTLSSDCWIDLEAFSEAFQQGRQLAGQGRWLEALPRLRRAEALAGEEFLSDNYAEWAMPLRQRYVDCALECRTLLAEHFAARGKHLVAVELWKRVLKLDNCNEEAYRGLMEAYRALDREADVARAYQSCVKAFQQELQLPPPADLSQRFGI